MSEDAWASGLFEGEGYFSHQHGHAYMGLSMCDEDVVQRFAAAVGTPGKVRLKDVGDPTMNRKPQYEWRVYRDTEVQRITRLLWEGLGARRRARAVELGVEV